MERPRIFIGGTGRSGTTLLNQLMGMHPLVHAFPTEMRFLVDAGGLMNLVDAFTDRYSMTQSREALHRFETLMRRDLSTPGTKPYPRHDLPTWLGADHFHRELDRFVADLTAQSYAGSLRHVARNTQPTDLLTAPLLVPRHFEQRSALLTRAGRFLDELLMAPAQAAGKSTWCEKTPLNLLHADFLQELLPNSVFVHVRRDPRGVVESLTHMSWAPDDLDGACTYLLSTLHRWFQIAPKIDRSPARWLEIKLEDLASRPEETLARVARLARLPSAWSRLPPLNAERVSSWRTRLSNAEIHHLTDRLAPFLEAFGYAP